MNLNDERLQPLLDDLIIRHQLTTFIETGIGYGVSLEWATRRFADCWSCDVEKHQVVAALEKFPEAHIAFMESVDFLRYASLLARGKALFWLDAHDAHPDHGTGPLWPLEDELKVIRYLREPHDVILMDDITDPRFAFDTYVSILRETHACRLEPELGIMVCEPIG